MVVVAGGRCGMGRSGMGGDRGGEGLHGGSRVTSVWMGPPDARGEARRGGNEGDDEVLRVSVGERVN